MKPPIIPLIVSIMLAAGCQPGGPKAHADMPPPASVTSWSVIAEQLRTEAISGIKAHSRIALHDAARHFALRLKQRRPGSLVLAAHTEKR